MYIYTYTLSDCIDPTWSPPEAGHTPFPPNAKLINLRNGRSETGGHRATQYFDHNARRSSSLGDGTTKKNENENVGGGGMKKMGMT